MFFGDESLMHIFPILHPESPKSLEATDSMLAWFERQAELRRENRKKDPRTEENRKKLEGRIADGSISSQKVWACLRERIAYDEALMKRTALIDCTREYTYRQMFDEWERYAKAFSGLGICRENKSRAALCGAIAAEPLFALFGLNMTGAEVSIFSFPDFLPGGMWREMLEKEKITDLIITDIMVSPALLEELAYRSSAVCRAGRSGTAGGRVYPWRLCGSLCAQQAHRSREPADPIRAGGGHPAERKRKA